MKKILLLLLLCCAAATISYAQNNATIKGIVADAVSKKPLLRATIAVVNALDTSLVSYTVTKDDGSFMLSRLPTTRSLKLIITYVGYETYRKDLSLKTGQLDLSTIYMDGSSLNEIVITGERSPVVMKKDTIEFNAEAFKTRPNAAVEELLRLLPGVQVNENGEILVNGRNTSRILIDGKEFFGTNQLIALKNLDAELIDKIQVYLDRENDPDRRVNEINLKNVINLKLKSAVKKSTIGRFAAGAGTRERYEASGILSSFRDTLQFSVMGNANNLNSTGFSRNELYSMGGFNRSGTDQIDGGNFGGRQSGGLTNVKSGGLNINNNYGAVLKLNLAYFFGNTIQTNQTTNLTEQSINNTNENTVINSLSTDQYRRNSTSHTIGGLLEWKPDTNTTLRYRPNLSFSPGKTDYSSLLDQSKLMVGRLSETEGRNNNKSYSDAFSHNLNFYRRFKKGRSLSIDNTLTWNESGTDSYNFNKLTSFSSEVPASLFDRYVKSGSETKWSGLSVLYNLPLSKKLTAELFSNTRYYKWAEPVFTYDKNISSDQYDQFLNNQSNDFVRTGFFQNLKPLLSYQITPQLRVRAAIDLEIQDVNNKFNSSANDIRQKFTVWFPSLAIDYSGYSLLYQEWIDLPSLYYMQPLVRESSAQYKFVGNPELKAIRVRNLRGNFYKFINSHMLSLNGYANATFYEDSFVQRNTVDDKGFTTATVVNKGGSSGIYGGMNVSKQFKKTQKWQFGLGSGINVSTQDYVVFLNDEEARQTQASLSLSQDFNMNYKSLAMFNLYYRYNRSTTEYTNESFDNIANYSHNLGTSGTFRLPKRVVIESNYSYRFNPQIAQGFPKSSHIVNVALSLLTHKADRGQVKLSIYDLLNQNISVSRYGNLNALITNEQQILRRYVMLNYQYRFNILQTKK
ncbi:MAG: TonB-dependent receptor [Pedobacter sp.]|nr:MAG: TonB-dependent receptor [Pedobacter sp.]